MPITDDNDRSGGSRRGGGLSPSLSPIARFLGIAFCLFLLGFLLSWYYIRTHPSILPAPPSDFIKSTPSDPAAEGDISRGDELLRDSHYDQALALYQRLMVGSVTPVRETLLYRIGICQEALGRWDQALSSYIASAGNPRVSAAAELGQARIRVRRNQPAEAKTLLYNRILRSAEPGFHQQDLLADARYWLALALRLEAPGLEKLEGNKDASTYTVTDWLPEQALDWIALSRRPEDRMWSDFLTAACVCPRPGLPVNLACAGLLLQRNQSVPAPEPVAAAEGERLRVQRRGKSPESYRVRACKQAAVADLLDHLAAESKLSSEWSEEARQAVAGRSALMHVEDLTLETMFNALTDPVAISWKIDKGREAPAKLVSFFTEAEAPRTVGQKIVAAHDALQNAIVASPGHVLKPLAYLELGNLELAEGRPSEAVHQYQLLLKEAPYSRVAVEAHFNLGMCYYKLGKYKEAREAFFQVTDQAPGHERAVFALLQIGRMYLEEGDPERGNRALKRALAAARDASIRPTIVLTLAAAYLLGSDGQDRKENALTAHALIQENIEALNQDSYRSTAAFLEALARVKAISGGDGENVKKRFNQEAKFLLPAVKAVQDKSALGPVGKLLVLKAYGALEMTDRMTDCYKKSTQLKGEDRPKGPVAAEMTFTLAEALFDADQWKAAKPYFEVLAADKNKNRWVAHAQLRLAAIALQENRFSRCLEICQQQLRSNQVTNRPLLLKLMGEAYSELGRTLMEKGKVEEAKVNYRQAAECFAGRVP